MKRSFVFRILSLAVLSLALGWTIPVYAVISAYSQIEAESFSSQSGVEIESCSDTGGGQNIGYLQNGDYAVYADLDFGSGAMGFSARVASANSGGSIEIRLDSADGPLVGTCPVPGTGGWQNWVTVNASISGVSGIHDLYLKFTGTADLMNVNWFQFIPVATSAFSQIEAESFSSQSGVETESCSDTGSGQNIGHLQNGDYTVYANLDFGSGATGFSARVASANSGGAIEIRLDSVDGPLVGTCLVPGTGGWQTWITVNTSVSGVSGVHDLYLKFTGGSSDLMNVNWFTFSPGVPGAFSQIEAESFSSQSGVEMENCSDIGDGQNIGYLQNGDYAVYADLDFGSGARGFSARVASANSGGAIEIRVDSADGPLVGTCLVPGTGGWQTWITVNTSVSGVSGVHDLYLKFTGGGSDLMNVNWFIFSASAPSPNPTTPDFGPNVFIFDPSMSMAAIQSRCNSIFSQQEYSQFGTNRYALLFKPGAYNVDVNVGFYTQVLGLGQSPEDVVITGAVRSEADWMGGNATCTFWRSCENLSVVPHSGTNQWAVSQAAPFRRMHIRGSLVLDDGGWSSGGFIADSKIDGQVYSGSQQQWFSRNTHWGGWVGSNWNMVFVGIINPPSGNWPSPPYTVVNQTPVIREKPFLYLDAAGNYRVFVPALRANSQGNSWSNGATAGGSIPIEEFHIAKAGTDTAATINAALSQGKHLLLTPGIYHLKETIRLTRANTVVLGLGLATLIPDNGIAAMTVSDVPGVKIAGVLFDAGPINSPVLLEVGPSGSSGDHSNNPTSLHDVFFRVGGAGVGKATVSLIINSNNVIGDHFWVWRADHDDGRNGSVGWNVNTTTNGLIVNGNNVTIYGLFVEHYHQYQTIWNGNNGRTYFYQSEIPYDVPNQSSWMNGGVNGFASYKVANSVTNHEAWGLGIYCYFNVNPSVKLASAIEAPPTSGVKFHHVITVSLGGKGEITHIVNNTGDTVNSGRREAKLNEYP